MPLPTLDTPTYELVVPSTNKKIKYRPWLVKEEKVLMIALETGEASSIFQAIKNIIGICTFSKLDVDNLCTFDLEYIFLKIRAKSVGEQSKIGIKCEKCETSNTVEVDLDKITPPKTDKTLSNKIQLTPKIGVVLRWPTLDLVTDLAKEGNTENIDTAIKTIVCCIESVYDEENVYPAGEQTTDELIKFIESLSQEQFRKINDYIVSMPKLEYTCDFTCSNKDCGHQNSIKITGLQNFFE
jgi:hypothetical protein